MNGPCDHSSMNANLDQEKIKTWAEAVWNTFLEKRRSWIGWVCFPTSGRPRILLYVSDRDFAWLEELGNDGVWRYEKMVRGKGPETIVPLAAEAVVKTDSELPEYLYSGDIRDPIKINF
jgi:hypothetical protein